VTASTGKSGGQVVIPEELRYTAEHEWVSSDGPQIRVGITHYAQDALGDIVFIQLPAVGRAVKVGEVLGEIESTKSVSEIYAPVAGEIVARNERLDDAPELVNTDPYGEGWLVEIRTDGADSGDGLLDAAAYGELTAG
jgi:glycine cleavage system H protein